MTYIRGLGVSKVGGVPEAKLLRQYVVFSRRLVESSEIRIMREPNIDLYKPMNTTSIINVTSSDISTERDIICWWIYATSVPLQ